MSEGTILLVDNESIQLCISDEGAINILLADTVNLNGGVPSVIDHGSLAGLSDNDHPHYLHVLARLAEFSTEQAKADARHNLGLQVIDCGTF